MSNPHKESIDVSRYVAIGDSITAGYTDGGLCYYGQVNSYPNIIAKQFKLIGGGEFKQPYMHEESVGVGFAGNACMILQNISDNIEPHSATLLFKAAQGDVAAFSKNDYQTDGPFNNMGIPGIKATMPVIPQFGNPQNGEGNFNPFFTRMASNPFTASVLSDALAIKPTFFSLFIGNNDVLTYALSGAQEGNVTPLLGPPGIGFEESVRATVDAFIATGAKGVIANLSDLSTVPYFIAIPYNGLFLDEEEAAQLTKKHASLGITFSAGKNPFIISDPLSKPHGIRQIKEDEIIMMDILFDNNKEDYLRGLAPIPKLHTLINGEFQKIQDTIRSYNKFLENLAQEKNLAFVDVEALLNKVRKDRVYSSTYLKFNYKKGGVMSLDGLHPNAYGQSLLANAFLEAINAKYNTSIPLVNSENFKDIVFP